MGQLTSNELNQAAMNIILHAGNCRNSLNEALSIVESGNIDEDRINVLIKEAKEEITIAHRLQTNMIQSTIEDDKLQTTLLFTHAQDTLMTINSEMIMTKHLIKLYKSLYQKIRMEE